MKAKKDRRNEILTAAGFWVEATPERSSRPIEELRRETAEIVARAEAEEARLAALPDSARTITLGGDE